MEDLGFPNIYFKPPEYVCPIHGKVTRTVSVFVENRQIIYCSKCYNDFLKKNLPVLEDKELL